MLARFAIGVGGLALGLLSLSIARSNEGFPFSRSSLLHAVVWLGAGWVVLGGAVVFGSRRRSNLEVPILVAAGCAWLVDGWDLPRAESALVFTIGLVATGVCAPLTGWAMLGYPTGRLAGRVERVTIGVSLAGLLLLGVAPALFFDPQAAGCFRCPDNLLLLADLPVAVFQLNRMGLLLSAVSLVGAAAVAWWRFALSSGPRRRVVAPVYVMSSIYLLAVAWSYAAGVERGFVGSDTLQRRLWLAQAASLVGLGLSVGWASVLARRTRSHLAQIVVHLHERTADGSMRAALARTLGDPRLEVAYPLGGGRFVNNLGQSVAVPPTDGRSATPLIREGETVGVLIHRPGLLDDPALAEEVAVAARLALENERLQAGLRVQEDDLRASRARIVAAADAERHRLERNLHDGTQQRLIALLLGLRMLPKGVDPANGSEAGPAIEEVVSHVQRAVEALRSVAHGIHPAVLSEEGLGAALEALVESSQEPLSIDVVPDERFATAVENAAYRVIAETVKAGATRVRATRHDGTLVIDLDATPVPDRLLDLEDRLGALDGWIGVQLRAGGTVALRAEIPCD